MLYRDVDINASRGQVYQVLHTLYGKGGHPTIVRDNTRLISPLLQLPFFDAIMTLVRLEILLITALNFKPALRKLGGFLEPSFGPGTVYYEWPLLDSVEYVEGDYVCVEFHARKFLAEQFE